MRLAQPLAVFAMFFQCMVWAVLTTRFPAHVWKRQKYWDRKFGRFEALGYTGSLDLTADAFKMPREATDTGPDTYALTDNMLHFFSGFTVGITDRFDLTGRYYTSAPLTLRGKYQLSGKSESETEPGEFSTALSGGFGLLLAPESTVFYLTDLAFLAGYRPWKRHLVWLSPHLALAGLSGVFETDGSATQLGAGLGYQYTTESLFFRFESTVLTGSYSAAQGTPDGKADIAGFFFGALVGFLI